MKAVYYDALGAAADVLKIGELETPEPRPGEIRVKLHTSGLNPSDWKARTRGRDGGMPFPRIVPQSDGAGVVDAVGEGVDAARVGRRVWVMNGQWKRAFGTAAEYIALDQRYVIDLPDGADFADGACFGIPFLTAHRALDYGDDVAGRTVLVPGAAGAVGHHAVQIAKDMGAKVIATVSSDAKAERARAAGADEVVNYRSEDVPARIAALTGGRGVDRILELNLSANAPSYGKVLAPGGTVVIYGTVDPTASVPAQDFIPRGATLHWFIVYDLSDEQRAAGVAALNAMLAKGALKTEIAARFPLDEIVAAHELCQSGDYMGNLIVDIA